MLGFILWMFALTYLLAASFALAEMRKTRHTLTRGVLAKVGVALAVAAWPAEESYLQLRQYFSAQWRSAVPRYQDVAA